MNIEVRKRIRRFEHEVELLVMSLKPTMNILDFKIKNGICTKSDLEMFEGLGDTLEKITGDTLELSQVLDNFIQSES